MTMAIQGGRGDYRAGACNIGPEEIAARRRMGLVFLAIAVGLALLLLAIDAPAWIRIAIWPPLAAAFIDARAGPAPLLRGLRAGRRPQLRAGGRAHAQRIEDDEARATDRRTAIVMVTYCSLAAPW